MKKIIILFAMIGVCLFIGANLYTNLSSVPAEASDEQEATQTESTESTLDIAALKQAAAATPVEPSVPAGAVDVEPVVYGDADAPVIIEEFASFTCSHCAHFHRDILPKLKKQLVDTGLAQIRVYSFVRNSQDLEASMLVQCQKDNATRMKFADAIMRGQEQWSLSTNYQSGLKTIARVGGMPDADYDACVANESLQEKIIASRQWFDKQVKVDATPFFRIGGEVIKGSRDVDAFEQAIQKAVQPAPAEQ